MFQRNCSSSRMFRCDGVTLRRSKAAEGAIRILASVRSRGGTILVRYGAAIRGGRERLVFVRNTLCDTDGRILSPPSPAGWRQSVDWVVVGVDAIQRLGAGSIQTGSVVLSPVGDAQFSVVT